MHSNLEKSARKTIRKLRCSACGRAPTSKEQDEMFASFGHKLVKPFPEGQCLVWGCLQCFPKPASN